MLVRIRRFRPDEWRSYRDLRLRALADAPEAFGSTYEREAARSDGDWERRLREGARSRTEFPLVATTGDSRESPVGLAWARLDETERDIVHVYQMWVDPDHRGQGVGRGLLDAIKAWAQEVGARELRLGVTRGNAAAEQLYERAGFVQAGDAEPLRPGSPLHCQPMRLELTTASR